jgi:anti-sigma factor RsiW
MNPSCREIEPLLTPYVDQEATAAQRSLVAEHLQGCSTCRARAEAETRGRSVLRATSSTLREEAPARLVARCRPPARVAAAGWLQWRLVPSTRGLAMAAAALLIVTSVLFTFGGSSRVLAAGLALDHLKCFALFERSSAQTDAAALSRQLHVDYGWRLTVPTSSPTLKLQLVGGRRCFSTDGRVAHILYRHDGRPLSLFVMPNVMRGAAEVGVIGHQAIVWSRHGMTYAVVARERREDLERIAAYMKDLVE